MRLGLPHSKRVRTAIAGTAAAVLLAIALTPGERIVASLADPLSYDTLMNKRSPGDRVGGTMIKTKLAALAGPVSDAGGPPVPRQRVLPMLRDRVDGPYGAGPGQQGLGLPDNLGLAAPALGPLYQGPLIAGEPVVAGPDYLFPGIPGFIGGPAAPGGGGGPLVPTDPDEPVIPGDPNAPGDPDGPGTPTDPDDPDGPQVPGDPNNPGTPVPVPVPEPGTWVMLIAGVGVVGSALRRRRTSGATGLAEDR